MHFFGLGTVQHNSFVYVPIHDLQSYIPAITARIP